jgi:hypothetical protein
MFTIDDAMLRIKVHQSALKELLKSQSKTRELTVQIHACLFCKKKFQSHITYLLQHMFEEHGFTMGLIDNLVMVDVFLNILRTQLNALICIYCYKKFPDIAVLHRHLRRKKHFKIDFKNPLYDQFYVSNYLSSSGESLAESINIEQEGTT